MDNVIERNEIRDGDKNSHRKEQQMNQHMSR
jgi:hypothetical protein